MSHEIQFVKKYSRESKSPFDDASTSLWLANVVSEPDEALTLDYSRYIYAHRDACGRIIGISISKSMVAEHPDIDSQYLSGVPMLAVLLFYIDEIEAFCEHWADEFESFFLLPPDLFFEIAQWRWNAIVVNDHS
ncbi:MULTISPECIES: hypothetical protein [unclassified Pseudoalteromonas]|uniref:hypothetical protein n=1 Tax=unclassified Pseudoalteromonas TaxID=194690 RepID=UPI000CF5FD34|nr:MULTISPECIES: hypothetical protein [unclassified Pseudoalteromonas]